MFIISEKILLLSRLMSLLLLFCLFWRCVESVSVGLAWLFCGESFVPQVHRMNPVPCCLLLTKWGDARRQAMHLSGLEFLFPTTCFDRFSYHRDYIGNSDLLGRDNEKWGTRHRLTCAFLLNSMHLHSYMGAAIRGSALISLIELLL